jgi:predicted dehydrogenase
MSSPLKAVVIGAGQRANVYGDYVLRHPEEIRYVAVAEPDPARRSALARLHRIPPGAQFESWEPLLALPPLGQAAFVCTQDQLHLEPALAAMHAGYDVLLEKPMATREEECRRLVDAARETRRQLQICHVLRHTAHFRRMRDIIQSGRLGQVVNVSHRENVSYWHMAHSFVRGHWRNSAASSPMILAKCCHDLDILPWLLDRHCERLNSTGCLIHFRAENAPPGAPPRCTDGCPAASSCPYYAPFIYDGLTPLWRSAADSSAHIERFALRAYLQAPWVMRLLSPVIPPLRFITHYRDWPRSAVTADPTREGLMKELRAGPYGRCVYHCDNDVVDTQVVMMQFEGGLPVTLTMHGHSHVEQRTTRIEGTRASMNAGLGMGGAWIEVSEHRSGRRVRRVRYNTGAHRGAGHGGGDEGLMAAFVENIRHGGAEAVATAETALESHLLAFAAERSRVEGGRMIERNAWR